MKILFITLILLTSCSPKIYKKSSKSVLNVSLSEEISTIDPAVSYDTISARIVYQCYEQLFEYDFQKRPYKLKPNLAVSMPKIINDTTYIIKLKKNIPYHDHPAFKGKTRFVKAQDFITQIKRLAYIPTKSNGWWIFDNKIIGINKFRKTVGSDFTKFEKTKIEGLTAIDDHTLKIDLIAPYPQMNYVLSLSFNSPLPFEILEYDINEPSKNEIGTGPYKIQKFNRLTGAYLTKFNKYRTSLYPSQGDRYAHKNNLLKDAGKKIPFIENIHFKVIKEAQTRWLNFVGKKIDFLVLPKDNYSTVINPDGTLKKSYYDKGMRLAVSPSLTFWWISFNMTDPLLGKNKKLRSAIAHAIDIQKYIYTFTNNVALKANSIYPPGIPGYDPSLVPSYEFNLVKARKLLAEAGFPGGKGLPNLNYDVRGTGTTNRQQANFIKQSLIKIGINVDVVMNTFPAFLQKARKGKLQFWQDGWSMDYPDSENILQLLISKNHTPNGPNVTFYNNKEFDKLFNQLKYLQLSDKKYSIMNKMNQIIMKDLPWVMQYYARDYILYYSGMKNFRHSDIIYNSFKYLRF